jgi:acyl transferase domain-containing protein
VKIGTIDDRGGKAIEGSAEVAQPTTVHIFTGQGSQEPGIGMDLYNNSPAARAIWEAAVRCAPSKPESRGLIASA